MTATTIERAHPLAGKPKSADHRRAISAGVRRFHQRRQLANGLDLAAPDARLIDLQAVARGLAQVHRFNGRGVSVAEHAVRCAREARDRGYGPRVAMGALHHDDAEAYTGDVISPVKRMLGSRFAAIEKRVEKAIVQALDLDGVELHGPKVRALDKATCDKEIDGSPRACD